MNELNIEVVHDFKGKINGVVVRDKNVFWTSQYLLGVLDEHGFLLTDKMIETIIVDIEVVDYKYEQFSFGEFENEVVSNFEDGENKFTVYGDDYYFKETNEVIANANKKTDIFINDKYYGVVFEHYDDEGKLHETILGAFGGVKGQNMLTILKSMFEEHDKLMIANVYEVKHDVEATNLQVIRTFDYNEWVKLEEILQEV